jgi:hypothetical protein
MAMESDSRERRYLVFVSSTFEDLQPERQKVLQAILERRAFPDGMELFPAASEEQWQFIKHEIAICDYYIIVIAGKYGSMAKDGVSYTEKEFDYAVKLKKPIFAFLHKNPESLPGQLIERELKKRRKLEAFRTKAKNGRLVKYYTNPDELKSEVLNALSDAFDKKPVEGWVRAGSAVNVEGGLSHFREAFRDLSHEKMLRHSSTSYIVLNDGRGWIDSNRDLLESRGSIDRQTTNILVLHPQSPFLQTLVKKNGKLLDAQIDDIRRTYRVVEGLRERFGDGFQIRGHDGFNPYSLFLGDQEAYMMPYFLNENGQLPVCIFQNNGEPNSMYERYKKDVSRAFSQARSLTEHDFIFAPPGSNSSSK